MNSEIPVTQAREELAELINRVAYGHERIVLTRHSRPVACIVPPNDLTALEDLDREAKESAQRASVEYIGLRSEPGASSSPSGQSTAPGVMPIAARHQPPEA